MKVELEVWNLQGRDVFIVTILNPLSMASADAIFGYTQLGELLSVQWHAEYSPIAEDPEQSTSLYNCMHPR